MTEKNPKGKKDDGRDKLSGQEMSSYQEPPAAQGEAGTEPEADEDADTGPFQPPPEDGGAAEDAGAAGVPDSAAFFVPEDLLQVKSAIEQQLMKTAAEGGAQAQDAHEGTGNIQGVGIGLGGDGFDTSGADPGEPVLNVYVAEPVSAEQVRTVAVDSMGISAASSEDIPVNVIVSGPIDAQPHRFKIRPAPGGVSVGHFRVTAGTLGCLAVGLHAPRTSRLLVLSNNHVLANSNAAAFGDCISQPGRYDGGVCPADRIAILERFVRINFSGSCNYVDCATGWAWPQLVRRELIYISGGVRRFFRVSNVPRACAIGMTVGKTGRTTQLTVGRITDCSASVRVNYGNGRVALFCDQIVIRSINNNPFSAGGDSGSLIWTWDARRNPVGLLFAGGGGLTIANKIRRVLAALDIRLYT